MKNYLLLFAALLMTTFLVSCQDEEDGEGNLIVKFNPSFNSQPLQLNTTYMMNGDSVSFSKFQFYVSNITTTDKDDNSTITIKDVELIDIENTTEISLVMPKGSYKNISIGVGLDETLNGSDPSSYASSHPLSLDNSSYWMMANSYIFLKVEGMHTSNGVETPVVYHVGKNGFYSELATEDKSYSINDGLNTTILVNMDVEDLFSTLTLPADSETHTGNNLPLATQVMNNLVGSISIQ